MLTDLQKEIIKQSFPSVLVHTIKNGGLLYEKLFELVPEAKYLFQNTSMEKQSQMLVAAIGKIVKSIDMPEILVKDLVELAKRHKNYGLQPEYFVHFGSAFLFMLSSSLDEAWNNELEDAWKQVYENISEIMIREVFT
jgi:nitric oxide dioxygenase